MLLFSFLMSVSMMSLTKATCSISPSANNIVATRLEGNWTFNGDFSALLSPDGMKSLAPVGEMVVSYANDSSVLDDIPTDNCSFLEKNGLDIYLAGILRFMHVEFGVMSHTFILTSMYGVPAIIYWQGVNAVTNFIQMAPAIKPENDLVFLGESSPDKPFTVLGRAGARLSLCRGESREEAPRQ